MDEKILELLMEIKKELQNIRGILEPIGAELTVTEEKITCRVRK